MVKILVVEDDKTICELMTFRLQVANYETCIAANGLEAMIMAQAEEPDLILMDMRLPLLDGWEATRQLKETPATRHIPIIALTAQTLSVDRQKCFAVGCDDYVAKPIEFADLFTKIENILEKAYP